MGLIGNALRSTVRFKLSRDLGLDSLTADIPAGTELPVIFNIQGARVHRRHVLYDAEGRRRAVSGTVFLHSEIAHPLSYIGIPLFSFPETVIQ